ncbi:MAG: hypothetical protein E6Q34_06550 [Burkholderiaceae bacterium]|jgi:hypothetical protein|nr:MAG: hypothetical protein E6Q34_06550 [Burkholderiaceae bacterium]
MSNEIKSHLLIGNKYLGSLLYFKDAQGRGCLKLSFKNKVADFTRGTDVPTTLPVPVKRTDPTTLDISYKFPDSLLEVKEIVNGKTERAFYNVPLPISGILFMIRIKDWQTLDDDQPKPNPLVLTPPTNKNSVVIIFSFLGENGLPFTAGGYQPVEGMGTIDLPENPLNTFCIGLAEDPNNNSTNGFELIVPLPKKD